HRARGRLRRGRAVVRDPGQGGAQPRRPLHQGPRGAPGAIGVLPFDPKDPAFFDPAAVEKELERVTDICNGCRRCYRLCSSFDYMLDVAVDGHDGDVAQITTP